MAAEMNSLGETLTVTQTKEKIDAACKAVLAEKSILAWFLKECVPAFKDMDPAQIIPYIEGEVQIGAVPVGTDLSGKYLQDQKAGRIKGSQTEDTSVYEGTVRYDIRFTARVPGKKGTTGVIVNIEAQNSFNPGYHLETRGIYYCARLLAAQKETVFEHSDFDSLQKVYSIWVCLNPPKGWQGAVNQYRMQETQVKGSARSNPKNYDKLEVVLVCLNGNQEKGLVNLLDIALSKQLSAQRKAEQLREKYEIATSENLEKGLSAMCNYSEGVWNDGKAAALVDAMKALMENAKVSAEQAAKMLNLHTNPPEIVQAVLEALAQKES